MTCFDCLLVQFLWPKDVFLRNISFIYMFFYTIMHCFQHTKNCKKPQYPLMHQSLTRERSKLMQIFTCVCVSVLLAIKCNNQAFPHWASTTRYQKPRNFRVTNADLPTHNREKNTKLKAIFFHRRLRRILSFSESLWVCLLLQLPL